MSADSTKSLSDNLQTKLQALIDFSESFSDVTVALSGGVDSMLLTYILHAYSSVKITPMHAASPAVPESALNRINEYAQAYNWNLQIIDAQELNNPNYSNNPVNRCYFCKSSLYQRISEHSANAIFSGTNMDDLSDYRPGLIAADENKVSHPYVEANINKSDIYALAEFFGLTGLQSLPAQPCLASRIETGIKVTADDLLFIDQIEQLVRGLLPDLANVRCRITHQGVVVELDVLPEHTMLTYLQLQISPLCLSKGRHFVEVRHYQKGSAFLTSDSSQLAQIQIKQVS